MFMPGFVSFSSFSCVRVCVYACLSVFGRGSEIRRRWRVVQRSLSHSEASPSVHPGLIVPGCEDIEKARKATVLVPCPRVISVTLKEQHQHAPDYCHVNNGTWLDSLLMNVIYFSKRGLIINRGPLSPPTGSMAQLAAKRWLLIFVFFKYVCMYAHVHMFLRHGG